MPGRDLAQRAEQAELIDPGRAAGWQPAERAGRPPGPVRGPPGRPSRCPGCSEPSPERVRGEAEPGQRRADSVVQVTGDPSAFLLPGGNQLLPDQLQLGGPFRRSQCGGGPYTEIGQQRSGRGVNRCAGGFESAQLDALEHQRQLVRRPVSCRSAGHRGGPPARGQHHPFSLFGMTNSTASANAASTSSRPEASASR